MREREGVFLQVRLDSKRLPKKALLPLAGVPVIVHAMRALKRLDCSVHAIVTDESSARELLPYAEAEEFELFAGNPDDVLNRYAEACRCCEVDRIVRATGDNPLVSWEMASAALEISRENGADYAGILEIPYGSGVEVLSARAVLSAEEESTDRYDREHVSPFIQRNVDRYVVVRRVAPRHYRHPDLRVTLDTEEDYHQLAQLFANLYHGKPIGIDELITYAIGQRNQATA